MGQDAASERHHCRNTNVGAHCYKKIMFQKLLIFIIGTLIISCGPNPKTIQKDPNSRQVEIDFADISVSLPKVFQRFSPEELIYELESLDSVEISENDRLTRIDRIEAMRSTNMKFYIYVDTTDINNTIIFLAEKYLKLDKEVRQYILSNADKTLKPKADDMGVEIKRVDSKFLTGKRTDVLKLKYEMKGTDLIAYWTTYMVTTASNSFQIFVTRTDTVDYEDKITRMKVGL